MLNSAALACNLNSGSTVLAALEDDDGPGEEYDEEEYDLDEDEHVQYDHITQLSPLSTGSPASNASNDNSHHGHSDISALSPLSSPRSSSPDAPGSNASEESGYPYEDEDIDFAQNMRTIAELYGTDRMVIDIDENNNVDEIIDLVQNYNLGGIAENINSAMSIVDTNDTIRVRSRVSPSRPRSRRPPPQPVASTIHSPEVTIYSEEDAKNIDLEVPLQVKFTGKGVIPPLLASIRCDSVSELLDMLNDVLGTTYTLGTPSLAEVLQFFIDAEEGYDFGMIYGLLRRFWFWDFATLLEKTKKLQACHEEILESAIDREKHLVKNPFIRPRRYWDLYSNRVLPIWAVIPVQTTRERLFGPGLEITPVSHSWMDTELRYNIDTPINGYQWPVPIPIDTTLERVRIELLNLGAQYVWLDVLCLRQQGSPENEALRLYEWELDVPTIGSIYSPLEFTTTIVYYYSGLGRPFHIGDLASERHWLNRAWTLQETTPNCVIAGLTADSPVGVVPDPEIGYAGIADIDVRRFYEAVHSCCKLVVSRHRFKPRIDVFSVVRAMNSRFAVNEVDKIAGLHYVLHCTTLPGYDPNQTTEDAWRKLVEVMEPHNLSAFLFLYPARGEGRWTWVPSWRQIQEESKLSSPSAPLRASRTQWSLATIENDKLSYSNVRLDDCKITGLEKADLSSEDAQRTGSVSMPDRKGKIHDFQVSAFHSHPIPDGSYVLILDDSSDPLYWVVGRYSGGLGDTGGDSNRSIEKISVVTMEAAERRRFKKLKLPYGKENYFI